MLGQIFEGPWWVLVFGLTPIVLPLGMVAIHVLERHREGWAGDEND